MSGWTGDKKVTGIAGQKKALAAESGSPLIALSYKWMQASPVRRHVYKLQV